MGQEIRIWGKLEDCNQQSLAFKKVALLKKYYENRRPVFKVVDWTHTDQQGNYEFYIQAECSGDYRVLVYVIKGGESA